MFENTVKWQKGKLQSEQIKIERNVKWCKIKKRKFHILFFKKKNGDLLQNGTIECVFPFISMSLLSSSKSPYALNHFFFFLSLVVIHLAWKFHHQDIIRFARLLHNFCIVFICSHSFCSHKLLPLFCIIYSRTHKPSMVHTLWLYSTRFSASHNLLDFIKPFDLLLFLCSLWFCFNVSSSSMYCLSALCALHFSYNFNLVFRNMLSFKMSVYIVIHLLFFCVFFRFICNWNEVA